MKKIFYLAALVTISSLFVQCEKNNDEITNEKHEYIDLGLSVKWATCNVGATTPEQYGDYFAWGEVKPKSYYDWGNYNYCIGTESTLTKYCFDSEYGKNGFTDDKLVLDASDDAASVILKGKWRMPTAEERDELIDEKKCKWEYVVVNGVKGAKVTSKVKGYEGRSIFLPAAGWQREAMQVAEKEAACYWTSTICTQTQYTDAPSNACALSFSYTQQMNGYAWEKRFYGCCIRPVHP